MAWCPSASFVARPARAVSLSWQGTSRGSIIAIDSAVPRREEAGSDIADEQMANGASNPLTIGASYPLSVLSPTTAGFANGVGSPGSSFGAGRS